MTFVFGFFSDPALTTAVSAPLSFAQDVSDPRAVDKAIYFGAPVLGVQVQSAVDPGVAPIVVAVADGSAGAGSTVADVRLALSTADLNSAVGGGALGLPATVLGGAENALAVYVRVLDSTHAAGLHDDLSLTTGDLVQT